MLNSKTVRTAIAETRGKIFSIVFVKKDNTQRRMLARTGVRKYLSGGESKLNPEKFITVYDLQNKGYRAVNVDTVQQIKFKNKIIEG